MHITKPLKIMLDTIVNILIKSMWTLGCADGVQVRVCAEVLIRAMRSVVASGFMF